MPGKPYQSILIPYEEEILSLRRQRPPMAFARIAELLKEKHQVSIQRAAICKFVKVRPWLGWKNEKPASREKKLTTFTPSNEYNLTRLSPEEAAAYVEQLRREREKNGG